MTTKLKFLLGILLATASLPGWSAPVKSLSAEQMFQILASEISLQRGEAATAYQTYMSMARSLRDGPLAQRAMEIAIAGNSSESALEAAKLWDEINPKDAKEILNTNIEAALAPFDLKNQLSSNRTQGIPNMIALIQQTATRYAVLT